jgi:hypothetical protein
MCWKHGHQLVVIIGRLWKLQEWVLPGVSRSLGYSLGGHICSWPFLLHLFASGYHVVISFPVPWSSSMMFQPCTGQKVTEPAIHGLKPLPPWGRINFNLKNELWSSVSLFKRLQLNVNRLWFTMRTLLLVRF